MSDTESSARSSDEEEEEEDVDEEESEEEEDEEEEGEEEEVEEEEEEDTDVENEESVDENDEDTDENDDENDDESDYENKPNEDSEDDSQKSDSNDNSDSDEQGGKIKGKAAKIRIEESKTETSINAKPEKSVRKEKLDQKIDSDHGSNSDKNSDSNDNSESEEQESDRKVKGLADEIENKESIEETQKYVQPVKAESQELRIHESGDDSNGQESSDSDKQESEGKVNGARIETKESKKETKSKPKHVEDEPMKKESPELKQKSGTDYDSISNSKSDEQESVGTVKDPAAKTENKESKIKAQPVESVRKESPDSRQKSDSAEDSKANENSKSDKQESGGKLKGLAAKMENKESEKEIKIKPQPVESGRKESSEFRQKSDSVEDSKGKDNSKSDEQESGSNIKDPTAKTEIKQSKIETKIMAQPVKDESVKKESQESGQRSHSADNYKSDGQVMEVKVPAAKTEIKESQKETKINTQPVETDSVRKKSSEQANKALPTKKKETKEDFRQITEVPRGNVLNKSVQVDRSDVMSTRRIGTQTELKQYSVGTLTSGLIKKVNMQTYTSGLISTSDHSTNTIQGSGKHKKTQTTDIYVLERQHTVKYDDSSEEKITDNKDPTKESGENETSVQLKRSKVKIPLLKLSPEEESNSANLNDSTEDRPPQPDSLSKKGAKSKDSKSNQKYQKSPLESSGVYSDKEYDKKTRKEKENIRRQGRRRRQFFIYSKRHPSGEYIPKPSKNKTSHFRPNSAGSVYKRESIHLIHRPGDPIPKSPQNKKSLARPNSAGPVYKSQSKHPEGTPLSTAQYRMLYRHRWADIPF